MQKASTLHLHPFQMALVQKIMANTLLHMTQLILLSSRPVKTLQQTFAMFNHLHISGRNSAAWHDYNNLYNLIISACKKKCDPNWPLCMFKQYYFSLFHSSS